MDYFSVFILLRLLLLLTIIYEGYKISFAKKNVGYFNSFFFSLLSYSLIEGLRFNRGVDYNHYKNLYENSDNLSVYWEEDSIEPFFQIFNLFFKFFGFPYYCLFLFYSLILIFSVIYFLRAHSKVAYLALPLFFLATIAQSENLVRQFFAFSIFLTSINFFLTHRYRFFSLVYLVAFFTHYSIIIFFPCLIIIKFIKKPFGNLYVILIIYIISWFVRPEYLGMYNSYFELLPFGGVYQRYIDNSDIWLSGTQLQEFDSSVFYFIRLMIFNITLIVLGHSLIERYRNFNFKYYYYLYLIGAFSQIPTFRFELLSRISLFFYLFWFIVLAYILNFIFRSNTSKLFLKFIGIFLLFNCFYDYLISPLLNINISNTLFVWNI